MIDRKRKIEEQKKSKNNKNKQKVFYFFIRNTVIRNDDFGKSISLKAQKC